MKVLLPERYVRLYAGSANFNGASQPHYCGIPLGNSEVEVASFFHQITSGKEVNDVIHAKLVDNGGNSYTRVDQVVNVNGVRYVSEQCLLRDTFLTSGSSDRSDSWFGFSHWTTEKEEYWTTPNPEYKGKKPFIPRLRTRWVRKYWPYGAEAQCWLSTRKLAGRTQYRGRVSRIVLYTPQPNIAPNATKANVDRTMVDYFGGSPVWQHPQCMQASLDMSLYNAFSTGRWYNTAAEASAQVNSLVCSALSALDPVHLTKTLRAYGSHLTRYLYLDKPGDSVVPQVDLEKGFLLQEPDIYLYGYDPIMLGKDVHSCNYWRNFLTQHALCAALENLPSLSDNSIQNIMSLVGFMKALLVDHKIEMPKNLQSAWLQYRYVYKTTEMDAKEAVKFVKRHLDLGSLDRPLVGRGDSTIDYRGTSITCRCSVTVEPKEVSTLRKLWRALDTYGLTPDFYVIWDMIPYSFMVDWFIPIGDLAGVWDANSMYFSGEFYKLSDISFSLSYTRDDLGHKSKYYTRWAGSVPSRLEEFYWLEPGKTSTSTGIMRLLDTLSIFSG